jgi:recombinase-like zinc beta ribbon protein
MTRRSHDQPSLFDEEEPGSFWRPHNWRSWRRWSRRYCSRSRTGLLRCGHCGRKLYVAYGGATGRYVCHGAILNHGERCISFGSLRADHAVGTEVVRVLKPLGIDAAVKALGLNGALRA